MHLVTELWVLTSPVTKYSFLTIPACMYACHTQLTMLASLPVFVPTDWSNPSVPDPAWQLPQSGGICDVPQCSANGG
jgi:hypothetical protein